jgi:hypothetical protein
VFLGIVVLTAHRILLKKIGASTAQRAANQKSQIKKQFEQVARHHLAQRK